MYLYLALAPALALALYVYWRDKYEKEPIGVLVVCFVMGSLCCLPAGFFNVIGAEVLGFDFDGKNGLAVSFFMAFCVVGLGEELSKYIVLVLFFHSLHSMLHSFTYTIIQGKIISKYLFLPSLTSMCSILRPHSSCFN